MIGRNAGIAAGAGIALFGALQLAGEPALSQWALLAAFAAFCFGTSLSTNAQIGIGALLGLTLGTLPGSGIESISVVGQAFIALLKMLIAPMIALAIAHGIGGMGAVRDVGRMGVRTLALYLLTMAFAVATGLLFVNVFQPGIGSGLAETEFFQTAVAREAPAAAIELSIAAFLQTTVFQILSNPIAAIAEGRILPIVFFALLLGMALLQMGERARPLVDVLGTAFQAIMRILGWFIRLAPLGILALIGNLVAGAGLAELARHLGAFAAVVTAATLVHAVVTLPLFAQLIAEVRPLELFRALREALAVAFSTSSSAATLPVTTRCVEQNLGVPREVSSFVLPLGATLNMDGTALYEAIAAIFVANVYGIELGLGAQLLVFVMAMVMATGAPGIPSAGMVTMIVVLEAVGLPAAAVGLLITIDRVLDTIRTMANVEGDAVVAVCVARMQDRGRS